MCQACDKLGRDMQLTRAQLTVVQDGFHSVMSKVSNTLDPVKEAELESYSEGGYRETEDGI